MKTESGVSVSYERNYQHLWRDKQNGGHLYLHLRRHAKRYQKRSNAKASRGQIKNRVITQALGAQVYFAHPYRWWERGLNENINGLLRQYWPKKTDVKVVDHEEVKRVINQLHDRPRTTLAFQKPATLMHNHLAALAP